MYEKCHQDLLEQLLEFFIHDKKRGIFEKRHSAHEEISELFFTMAKVFCFLFFILQLKGVSFTVPQYFLMHFIKQEKVSKSSFVALCIH